MSTVDLASTHRRRRTSERPPEDHRFTLKVPRVDTSVVEWWESQHDPSASVRALIRDEIMRHGFTDTVNRPVTQLPRRGRPPGSGRGMDAAPIEHLETTAQEPAVHPWPAETKRRSHVVEQTETQVPIQQADPIEDIRTTQAHPVADEPEPETEPVGSGGGQFDMDDIFGHGG